MTWKRTAYSYGKGSFEPDWVVLVEKRDVVARVATEEEAKRMVEELEEEQANDDA